MLIDIVRLPSKKAEKTDISKFPKKTKSVVFCSSIRQRTSFIHCLIFYTLLDITCLQLLQKSRGRKWGYLVIAPPAVCPNLYLCPVKILPPRKQFGGKLVTSYVTCTYFNPSFCLQYISSMHISLDKADFKLKNGHLWSYLINIECSVHF